MRTLEPKEGSFVCGRKWPKETKKVLSEQNLHTGALTHMQTDSHTKVLGTQCPYIKALFLNIRSNVAKNKAELRRVPREQEEAKKRETREPVE